MKNGQSQRRLVDFFRNSDDLQAIVLGSLGFSTAYISKVTHLSEGQVLYRLGKATVSRLSYRNGQSKAANFVLNQSQMKIASDLKRKLLK